ncbi:MAG: CIA30 family protein [Porticoccaceae bacterium]|nr:CIA30 family protein [Porticoccaceae bacterium]MDG1311205.1 CIA30 family protein [Porticoccaceae bacterium]
MNKVKGIILTVALSASASTVGAENLLSDTFNAQSQLGWAYFSDQVMGGISEGSVEYMEQDGENYAHMTGRVSTENNGGFIQIRRTVPKGSVGSAAGVYLKVRGNSQGYYIHLRTSGTVLPWQYYQAGFETTGEWQVVRLPLSAFERSGSWLRKALKPSAIRSIGILAYGRDHQAEIDVAEIGFYD